MSFEDGLIGEVYGVPQRSGLRGDEVTEEEPRFLRTCEEAGMFRRCRGSGTFWRF